MSLAAWHVQRAVIDALHNSVPVMATVSGVYDGAPARAAYPYITVGDGVSGDWSTKTAPGRELRLPLVIWDDGEDPSQLHSLIHQVEEAVAQTERDLDGWRVASLVFIRSLIARDPAGPWSALVEFRVRVMATD